MTETWKNSDFETGTAGHVWVRFCAKDTCLLLNEKKKYWHSLLQRTDVFHWNIQLSDCSVIQEIVGKLSTYNRVLVAHNKITVLTVCPKNIYVERKAVKGQPTQETEVGNPAVWSFKKWRQICFERKLFTNDMRHTQATSIEKTTKVVVSSVIK